MLNRYCQKRDTLSLSNSPSASPKGFGQFHDCAGIFGELLLRGTDAREPHPRGGRVQITTSQDALFSFIAQALMVRATLSKTGHQNIGHRFPYAISPPAVVPAANSADSEASPHVKI
jgi:hypothetical protein